MSWQSQHMPAFLFTALRRKPFTPLPATSGLIRRPIPMGGPVDIHRPDRCHQCMHEQARQSLYRQGGCTHGEHRLLPSGHGDQQPTSIKDARRAPTSQAMTSAHAQGRTLNRMTRTTSGSFKRCLRNAARRFLVADAFAGSLRGTFLSFIALMLQCAASIMCCS